MLLYISVGYVLCVRVAGWLGHHGVPPPPLGWARLLGAVGVVALASFVVRLAYPARSTQILDLHLWQWPQCAGMFGLGVAARRSGWHVRVPDRLYRGCGYAVAGVLAVVPVLALRLHVTNISRDGTPFLGGWHGQALLLDLVEASLVVLGSVWLLGLAQRRLTAAGRLASVTARGSYAAFVLQAPVLLLLSIAARGLAWPAEAKAFTVAAIAVPACFGLAWLTVHTRLARIL